MKRLLGVGIAIGVLCLAAFGAGVASGASKPTLIASRHVAGLPTVTYGSTIKLSGHESLGGLQTITLQGKVWPFTTAFQTVATGTTTGSYSFTVSPTHATRYRVLVGGKKSRVVTVYVLEKLLSSTCNLCSLSNTPGTHTLTVKTTVQAPPGPVAVTGPVYFYYAVASGTHAPNILPLVKEVSLHVSGTTLSFTVNYTVVFPSTAFRFAYAACYKDAESADGFGLPGHHHCGDATVNRHKYLA